MSKANQKGRSTAEARHTRLPHNMTGSPAWLDLSGAAVKLLIALQRLDRGGDNGALFMSARKASDETGLSRNTVQKAFRELEEHGFIAAVDRGHFQVKGGPATSWRLTFVATPAQSRPPTHDWLRWVPDGNKTRAQKLTPTGANIGLRVGNAISTGANIAPMTTETSHVSISAAGSNIAPQVVCHRQGADGAEKYARKHPENGLAVSNHDVTPDLLGQLRDRVTAYLVDGEPGTQTRLAASASIPGGTLSKFLAGKGLSRQHFVTLQLALRGAEYRKVA